MSELSCQETIPDGAASAKNKDGGFRFSKDSNWVPCACTLPDQRCYDMLINPDKGATLSNVSNVSKLYHLALLEKGTDLYEQVVKDLQLIPGVELDKVFQVHNPEWYTKFCIEEEILKLKLGDPNAQVGYHVCKGDVLKKILEKGLDPRVSNGGFFGNGTYLTPDPLKANDYSPQKGDPKALRCMLRCQVLLGKSKTFPTGHFDRSIRIEPEGYDSVIGFIRRSTEYVIYTGNRAYVSYIIFYRFTDTQLEMTPSSALPQNVSGQTYLITPSLSEFFSRLNKRAAPEPSEQNTTLKKLIRDLLNRIITVSDFITGIEICFKSTSPVGLSVKLEAELKKCKLPPAPMAPPIPIAPRAPMAAMAPLAPPIPTAPPRLLSAASLSLGASAAGMMVPGSPISLLSASPQPLTRALSFEYPLKRSFSVSNDSNEMDNNPTKYKR